MKWEEFLKKTRYRPVIEAESLLAGIPDPLPVKVQLSRWCKAGKLIQARRGVYIISESYRKENVFEPYLASILKKPSYISLEKALEFHALIPEAVPVYTCLTTKRPGKFVSPAGVFTYRHIKRELFWGYAPVTVSGQTGFIARPEKALLDLIYLRGMNISRAWLRELRLQNTEKLDPRAVSACARRFKSPGMLKASEQINEYIVSYSKQEKTL